MFAWVPQSSGRGTTVEASELFELNLVNAGHLASRMAQETARGPTQAKRNKDAEAFGDLRERSGRQNPNRRKGWERVGAKHVLPNVSENQVVPAAFKSQRGAP